MQLELLWESANWYKISHPKLELTKRPSQVEFKMHDNSTNNNSIALKFYKRLLCISLNKLAKFEMFTFKDKASCQMSFFVKSKIWNRKIRYKWNNAMQM